MDSFMYVHAFLAAQQPAQPESRTRVHHQTANHTQSRFLYPYPHIISPS